jgi:hypothetical protein
LRRTERRSSNRAPAPATAPSKAGGVPRRAQCDGEYRSSTVNDRVASGARPRYAGAASRRSTAFSSSRSHARPQLT